MLFWIGQQRKGKVEHVENVRLRIVLRRKVSISAGICVKIAVSKSAEGGTLNTQPSCVMQDGMISGRWQVALDVIFSISMALDDTLPSLPFLVLCLVRYSARPGTWSVASTSC